MAVVGVDVGTLDGGLVVVGLEVLLVDPPLPPRRSAAH